jgi:tetratricopeptide (TPR) repeat protein
MRNGGYGAALLLSLVLVAPARGDEVAEARTHYRNATRAYELGAYDEAIREYGEAYRLKDDPAILYNMAQAHRLAEHHAEALRLYRMYLIKVPDASNRSECLAKIEALQKLVDDAKKAKSIPPDTTLPHPVEKPAEPAPAAPPPVAPAVAPTPAAAPAAPTHSGRGKKIGGLVVGIIGVAALGAGIGLATVAKSDSDALTKANSNGQSFDRSKYDSGKSDNVAGGVLMGVGGAAVVAGIIVGVLGLREARESKVALAPWVSGSSAGAVLELRR